MLALIGAEVAPTFLEENFWPLLIAGISLIAAAWFWEQIAEFIAWKRGDSSPECAMEWVPLHKALRYIALESDWAYRTSPASFNDLDDLLEAEFLERLVRGDLAARGKTYLPGYADRLSVTTEFIPPEFWQTAFIQAFGEIVMADDNRCAAYRDGSYASVPLMRYRAIIVDMKQVRSVWPPASKRTRKVQKSGFHDALIRYWKARSTIDTEFRNGGSPSNVTG